MIFATQFLRNFFLQREGQWRFLRVMYRLPITQIVIEVTVEQYERLFPYRHSVGDRVAAFLSDHRLLDVEIEARGAKGGREQLHALFHLLFPSIHREGEECLSVSSLSLLLPFSESNFSLAAFGLLWVKAWRRGLAAGRGVGLLHGSEERKGERARLCIPDDMVDWIDVLRDVNALLGEVGLERGDRSVIDHSSLL